MFLMTFISGDPRQLAPRRQEAEYDTEIFFAVLKVFTLCECYLVPSDGMVTGGIPPRFIVIVHFVEISTEPMVLKMSDTRRGIRAKTRCEVNISKDRVVVYHKDFKCEKVTGYYKHVFTTHEIPGSIAEW